MAITWSIVQLDYVLSEDGHTDVVNLKGNSEAA